MGAVSIRAILLLLVALNSTGCGKYPASLASARDIQHISKETEQIVIGFLPMADYPLLTKFQHLKAVSFFMTDGTGANDEKLQALSKIRLPELAGVTLLNCPGVTDEGIRHLSRIPSIKWLGLEGTSITDESLVIMSKDMKLTGVNVANCSGLTVDGLIRLARSETLQSFTFPAESLTQEDVARLIGEFKPNLKWPSVVDLAGKLNASQLESIAQQRGFSLNVKRSACPLGPPPKATLGLV